MSRLSWMSRKSVRFRANDPASGLQILDVSLKEMGPAAVDQRQLGQLVNSADPQAMPGTIPPTLGQVGAID